MLELRDVGVSVGRRVILEGISLSVAPGEVLGIVGPRDACKTTLWRVLAGEVSPSQGRVRLGDTILAQKSLTELTRQRACVTWPPVPQVGLSALEVVLQGRTPHRLRESRTIALRIAREAMAFTHAAGLADEPYADLPAQQQHCIQLARALSQIWERKGNEARLLSLDEPEINLDVRHHHAALEYARHFASTGVIVVVLLGELGLAARCTDQVLILESGRTLAYCATREIVPDARIQFGHVSARSSAAS